MNKPLIYLADLTHTGQSIASNVFPLAIGLIASYVHEVFGDRYEIELFKYPDDLNAACQRQMPDVVGFSNYSWNCHLSYQFAKRIKQASARTVIVFGGPNYGLSDFEIKEFWARCPAIDFNMIKEGEIAFVKLLELLQKYNFDAESLKNSNEIIFNAHYFKNGVFAKGEILPRIQHLHSLGSPYLKGYMDKFFDSVLIPMVHTTRGCPFTCTFCTEGNPYYNKVAQRPDLQAELEYIGQRVKSVQDLIITDANFGMYMEDVEKAKIISSTQKKFGWPKRILVSTGKNKKERIVEVASILDGTMSIAASLQTTDQEVLKNINRQNISSDALSAMVEQAQQLGTTTYTELILCLPGDSLKTHMKSLQDVVDSGLDIVRMFQLILLPQTEMCTEESRKKYGLVSKFRINPRSFGKYEILGETVASVESEEIVVANNTLPPEDYITCREVDFTVEFIHNTRLFMELEGLCRFFKISWFQFIRRFYQKARLSPGLKDLYSTFAADTLKGLWNSLADLESKSGLMIDDLIKDAGGTNEMVKGKALAFFRYFSEINALIYSEFKGYLRDHNLDHPQISLYLVQLQELNHLKKDNFLQVLAEPRRAEINFDIEKIASHKFQCSPIEYYTEDPFQMNIQHDAGQIEKINAYIHQYGQSLEGLGRILMRAPISKLFRTITVLNPHDTRQYV